MVLFSGVIGHRRFRPADVYPIVQLLVVDPRTHTRTLCAPTINIYIYRSDRYGLTLPMIFYSFSILFKDVFIFDGHGDERWMETGTSIIILLLKLRLVDFHRAHSSLIPTR